MYNKRILIVGFLFVFVLLFSSSFVHASVQVCSGCTYCESAFGKPESEVPISVDYNQDQFTITMEKGDFIPNYDETIEHITEVQGCDADTSSYEKMLSEAKTCINNFMDLPNSEQDFKVALSDTTEDSTSVLSPTSIESSVISEGKWKITFDPSSLEKGHEYYAEVLPLNHPIDYICKYDHSFYLRDSNPNEMFVSYEALSKTEFAYDSSNNIINVVIPNTIKSSIDVEYKIDIKKQGEDLYSNYDSGILNLKDNCLAYEGNVDLSSLEKETSVVFSVRFVSEDGVPMSGWKTFSSLRESDGTYRSSIVVGGPSGYSSRRPLCSFGEVEQRCEFEDINGCEESPSSEINSKVWRLDNGNKVETSKIINSGGSVDLTWDDVSEEMGCTSKLLYSDNIDNKWNLRVEGDNKQKGRYLLKDMSYDDLVSGGSASSESDSTNVDFTWEKQVCGKEKCNEYYVLITKPTGEAVTGYNRREVDGTSLTAELKPGIYKIYVIGSGEKSFNFWSSPRMFKVESDSSSIMDIFQDAKTRAKAEASFYNLKCRYSQGISNENGKLHFEMPNYPYDKIDEVWMWMSDHDNLFTGSINTEKFENVDVNNEGFTVPLETDAFIIHIQISKHNSEYAYSPIYLLVEENSLNLGNDEFLRRVYYNGDEKAIKITAPDSLGMNYTLSGMFQEIDSSNLVINKRGYIDKGDSIKINLLEQLTSEEKDKLGSTHYLGIETHYWFEKNDKPSAVASSYFGLEYPYSTPIANYGVSLDESLYPPMYLKPSVFGGGLKCKIQYKKENGKWKGLKPYDKFSGMNCYPREFGFTPDLGQGKYYFRVVAGKNTGSKSTLPIYGPVTQLVEVSEEPGPGPDPQPLCSIDSVSPSVIPKGGSVFVNVSYSDFSVNPSVKNIDCGDGATKESVNCNLGICEITCEGYNQKGTFSVKNVVLSGNQNIDCSEDLGVESTDVNVLSETEVNESYWSDLHGIKISKTNLSDRVRLNAFGKNFSDEEINFTIFRDGQDNGWKKFWNAITFGVAYPDSEEDSITAKGNTTWRAGKNSTGGLEKGTYYFIAEVVGTDKNSTSNNLKVVNEENTPPEVAILDPSEELYAGEVPFSFSARDEDDYLKSYEWVFGDGETKEEDIEDKKGVKKDTTHEYDSKNEYVSEVTVTDERDASNSEEVSFDYAVEGINVFSNISKPKEGKEFDESEVNFSGKGTYVINITKTPGGLDVKCLGGACPQKIIYNGNPYNVDENGILGDYNEINFIWRVGGDKLEEKSGKGNLDFSMFFSDGDHEVNLTAKYDENKSSEKHQFSVDAAPGPGPGPVPGFCSSFSKKYCSQYSSPDNCTADPCNFGKKGMGFTNSWNIVSDPGCNSHKNPSDPLSDFRHCYGCKWDDDRGCYFDTEMGNFSCEFKFSGSSGGCEENEFVRVDYNAILWNDSTSPSTKINDKEIKKRESCVSEERTIPCPEKTKVPFFEIYGVIGVIVMLVIVYYLGFLGPEINRKI